MDDSPNFLLKNKVVVFCGIFFLALTFWWLTMYSRHLTEGAENNAFTLIYPLMSLIGGIAGMISAHKWGGLKSYLGGALFFLAAGLLLQFFGQASYAYFIYIQQIEIPYPSIGDIGYFGSIVSYIIGLIFLGKVVGLKNKLTSIKGAILALVIPIALLALSYVIFLNGYVFDPTAPLTTFLDFGYPVGEALYVAIALIILTLASSVLGGVMKKPIFLLVFSLIIQYFCDFTFLYQVNQGTWYVGGPNDYLYFVSYFFMSITLIYIGSIFKQIKNS